MHLANPYLIWIYFNVELVIATSFYFEPGDVQIHIFTNEIKNVKTGLE